MWEDGREDMQPGLGTPTTCWRVGKNGETERGVRRGLHTQLPSRPLRAANAVCHLRPTSLKEHPVKERGQKLNPTDNIATQNRSGSLLK